MKYKRPYQPPFDPTITQSVKKALHESGHGDLVDGILDSGLKEIEREVDLLRKRIIALEEAERARVTETGVNKLIDARANAKTSEWTKWGLRLAIAGAGALAAKFIGKTT